MSHSERETHAQSERLAVGQTLLDLTDHLLANKDAAGLGLLDNVMVELMVSGVWTRDYDLLALGEYAEFAGLDLKAGKTIEEIKGGDVRKRAATPSSR